MQTLWQDLRSGVRMLGQKPGLTLIAILTLALGIGVNTALFTVFDAFVLKPLPLKDPDSIASIDARDRTGQRRRLFSYLDYLDYRDRNTVFAGLVAMNKFAVPFGEPATGVDDSPLLPANFGFGRLVSWNYFSVLGAEMARGRGFVSEEDKTPGTHPVLVLSHICWEQQFNSDGPGDEECLHARYALADSAARAGQRDRSLPPTRHASACAARHESRQSSGTPTADGRATHDAGHAGRRCTIHRSPVTSQLQSCFG
jgi:hypothetical protein